jgi:hypothetical protein
VSGPERAFVTWIAARSVQVPALVLQTASPTLASTLSAARSHSTSARVALSALQVDHLPSRHPLPLSPSVRLISYSSTCANRGAEKYPSYGFLDRAAYTTRQTREYIPITGLSRGLASNFEGSGRRWHPGYPRACSVIPPPPRREAAARRIRELERVGSISIWLCIGARPRRGSREEHPSPSGGR